LLVKRKQLIRAAMRARLKDAEKQAIYRKRKWVAEQVIGQIKEGLGFRRVTVRGEEFARAQWLFTCAVHNVMKAVRFIADLRKSRAVGVLAVCIDFFPHKCYVSGERSLIPVIGIDTKSYHIGRARRGEDKGNEADNRNQWGVWSHLRD
jgi:hypothetical protein